MIVDCKILPDLLFTSVYDRFDRAERQIDRLADFHVRHPAAIGKDHYRTFVVRQHGKQAIQVGAFLARCDFPGIRRFHRRPFKHFAIAIAAPPRLQKRCPRNAQQPAGEGAIATKAADLLKRMDERVLREVIGERRIPAKAQQENTQPRLVAPYQFAKAGGIGSCS